MPELIELLKLIVVGLYYRLYYELGINEWFTLTIYG